MEIQHLYPDPTNPDQTQISLFYSVPCEVRDGVFRVDKIATQRSQCPGYALVNADETSSRASPISVDDPASVFAWKKL
ncbi:hypothetical protein BZL30_9397 [Mycobacterium kansasii]|uniref:Uncharacterized protein n=1 Tax=Mycobacterium kansasii TaxID=1768 RepID=A0A1V3WA63_MYCKA|nr:hypothetical protein BZL30_9397 [Mycobacterium kansasii]